MNPLIQLKTIPPLLITLALLCLGLLPRAQAVDPPPDGGYPGQNTAEGQQALLSLTTGLWNTALGFQALKSDTTGYSNTATGGRALFSNTTGIQNTANGAFALFANTVGGGNSAFGFQALTSNTTGSGNTANGYQALASNTTGGSNTAVGVVALSDNTTGVSNTGIGTGALASNTSGNRNTANGDDALASNTTGDNNTANGDDALTDNTIGGSNTAIGARALANNTTGNENTANGSGALRGNTKGGGNTAVGKNALSGNNGFFNIALGWEAESGIRTGSHNIDIGNGGASADFETIRIGQPGIHGATFIYGIRGTTTRNANAIPVVIDSVGQLGTMSSSKRFKKEIKPMENASDSLLRLKPVTFHYKSDGANTPQFGLVAEEVAEVNPNLVVRDENGEIYSVRYEAVNAMLLNEFLKARRQIDAQQKQIESLAAGLQRVSAQLELSKPAPQTVLNDQ
jgi:Chaperone of endosialidase